jgi:hypothetical protein
MASTNRDIVSKIICFFFSLSVETRSSSLEKKVDDLTSQVHILSKNVLEMKSIISSFLKCRNCMKVHYKSTGGDIMLNVEQTLLSTPPVTKKSCTSKTDSPCSPSAAVSLFNSQLSATSSADIKLSKTLDGVEFLEYNERQTKTRNGANCRDVRPFTPKMFSTDGSEKDPVAVYKLFAQKRPDKMSQADAPFYLALNNTKNRSSLETKSWFKCNGVGVNKLGSLMKEMAKKSGLQNPKLRNHSARKTMIQTLSDSDVPPTHIAQLSGHKNLKSIENYSHISTKQQKNMSNMLANIASTSTSLSIAEVPREPATESQPKQTNTSNGQQSVALFSGAVIHGGQFSVTINTVNQSPTLQTPSTRQWKRIRLSKQF